MEEDSREKILLFHGKEDLTYKKIKRLKMILMEFLTLNKNYYEGLHETRKMAKEMIQTDDDKTILGRNISFAAHQVSEILGMIGDHHKDIFGDPEKYNDPEGPFGDLLVSSDVEFGLLDKKATKQRKEHEKFEKQVETSWQYYMRRVNKLVKLETKLSKTLTPDQLKADLNFIKFEKKTKLALSRYNACYRNEVCQRECLIEQTENLRRDFIQLERNKLQTMFGAIRTFLGKLEMLAPQGMPNLENMVFELGPIKTRQMAKLSWKNYLKEHVFPEKKGEEARQNEMNRETVDDDDEEEDDKEDDDDVDVDDRLAFVQRYRKHVTKLHSFSAPRVVKPGFNDAQQTDITVHDLTTEETSVSQVSRERSHTRLESAVRHDSSSKLRNSPEDDIQVARHCSDSHASPALNVGRISHQEAPKCLYQTWFTSTESSQENVGVGVTSAVHRIKSEAKAESADMTRPTQAQTRNTAPGLEVTTPDVVSSARVPTSTARKATNNVQNEGTSQTGHSAGAKKESVTVYAICDHKKRNSNEFSIRKGMKIRQTRAENSLGMAYGCKKTIFGVKKYGYFPASFVSPIRPEKSSIFKQ